MRGRKPSRIAILPSGARAVVVRVIKDVALVRRIEDREVFRIKTCHLKAEESHGEGDPVPAQT